MIRRPGHGDHLEATVDPDIRARQSGVAAPRRRPVLRPRLPARLDGLSFARQFRGTPILVMLAGGKLTLAAHREGVRRPISVGVGDEVRELCAGDRRTFELWPATHAGHQHGHR